MNLPASTSSLCSPKCSLWTNSTGSHYLGAHEKRRTLESSWIQTAFNKIPKWLVCTLKFEKHCLPWLPKESSSYKPKSWFFVLDQGGQARWKRADPRSLRLVRQTTLYPQRPSPSAHLVRICVATRSIFRQKPPLWLPKFDLLRLGREAGSGYQCYGKRSWKYRQLLARRPLPRLVTPPPPDPKGAEAKEVPAPPLPNQQEVT